MSQSDLEYMIRITVGNKMINLDDLKCQKKNEANWIAKICGVKENTRILDYGAGFGFIAKEIEKITKHVYTYNIEKCFIDYCENLGLKKYTNQSVDITIMKDVVENFTISKFDSILQMLKTKKVFFNFYDIENKKNPNIKYKHKINQIKDIIQQNNYKILLFKKNKKHQDYITIIKKLDQTVQV